MTYGPVAGLLFLICQFIRTESGSRPTCFCLLIVFRVLLAVACWNWSQGKQFHCNRSSLINHFLLCSSGCLLRLLLLFIIDAHSLLVLPLGLRVALNWMHCCVGMRLHVSTGQIQFLHFCACYFTLWSGIVPYTSNMFTWVIRVGIFKIDYLVGWINEKSILKKSCIIRLV